MALSHEMLDAIDRELDAFGKSPEELAAVVIRARALASSADDAGLSSLLEGIGDAVARAAEQARAALPAIAAAPASSAADPSAAREAARARAIEARPPVEPPAPTEKSATLRSDDIAGLSVDELFADVEPAAPGATTGALADLFDEEPILPVADAAPDGGLADLFEDEVAVGESAPEGGSLADLFEDEVAPEGATGDLSELLGDEAPADDTEFFQRPEAAAADIADLFDDEDEPNTSAFLSAAPPPRPQTIPPPLPSQRPPAATLNPFGEDDEERTATIDASELDNLEIQEVDADDDDFELLVDEDVLALDEAPATEDEGSPKPGLISRILGRK